MAMIRANDIIQKLLRLDGLMLQTAVAMTERLMEVDKNNQVPQNVHDLAMESVKLRAEVYAELKDVLDVPHQNTERTTTH